MSMSGWDMPNVSNGDNGSFDPPVGFGPNMTPMDFNPSQMQSQHHTPNPSLQYQQQMQNGNFRHASPAVQNQMFQTSSVVPSKRPHSEYSASPSQVSRSQTPQQSQGGAYPGYNPAVNGQQPPSQFPHLQQPNSNTASPSPVMQNQNFNPHPMGRMQTGSPSPFSPAGQGFGQQGSPPHMDQPGPFDQQSNGAPPHMQAGQQGSGQNPNQPNFSPTPGNPGIPMQGSPQQPFNPKNMTPDQQRLMYEQARLRQFPPNSAMAQQQRAMNQMNMMGGMNAVPASAGPGALAGSPQPQHQPQQQQQQPQPQQQQQQHQQHQQQHHQQQQVQAQAQANQHQQQQAQQAAMRNAQMQRLMNPQSPESFARSVSQFMQTRGMSFTPMPQICGRGVHTVAIYSCVMKSGGSRQISAGNHWGRVAQSLGFQPQQLQQAATELSNYWQTNLFPYEMTILQNLRNQQRQGGGGQPMGGRIPIENGHMQGSPPPPVPPQPPQPPQQPPQQGSPTTLQKRRQSTNDSASLTLPGSNLLQDPGAQQTNGLLNRDAQGQVAPGRFTPNSMYAPRSAKSLAPGAIPGPVDGVSSAGPGQSAFPPEQVPRPDEDELPSLPEVFKAKSSSWELYDGVGGILKEDGPDSRSLPPEAFTNQAQHIAFLIERYGVDILDITMRLKSGMRGEIRFALDFLSVSSVRREAPLNLAHCEDLVDTLLDCAEEALDQLVDHSVEIADDAPPLSYDALIRSCEEEEAALVDVHAPGSLEYNLENFADRLLCITSLLRTWSTVEPNIDPILADGSLVRFLATSIRYLSSRHQLLRSSDRDLDFLKDVLLLLSNLSLKLEFASRDEALQIIQFLLAFAPDPLSAPLDGYIQFPPYKPSVNHYLPLAVDVLSKILAHGDPNRGFLKSVFMIDLASEHSQDLLTRAFGLAISVLPCDLYRSGLKLQLKKAQGSEPHVKTEDVPKPKVIAQAKALMKARSKSASTFDLTTSAQLRQLRFQLKMSSSIKSIFNDSRHFPDSDSPKPTKEFHLLGPGKHPVGKWTAKLPCLVSGLLAADILLSLVPNARPEVIRAWTESSDGLILRLQKFIINSRHPPNYELPPPGEDDGDDRPSSKASGRPSSGRAESSRSRNGPGPSGGTLLPMLGYLSGELPEEGDLDSPTAEDGRPGSSAADEGGAREVRLPIPTSEPEAVAQMELDALTRATRILRRLVQRTSKAARLAARAAAAGTTGTVDA